MAASLLAVALLACGAQAFRVPRAPAGRAPALRVASAMEQQQALTLGAPRFCPPNGTYVTAGGVGVTRTSQVLPREIVDETVEALVDDLDERRGVLLASSYEFPGRYARWTVGFSDPPVVLSGRSRDFALTALNARGVVMLAMFEDALRGAGAVAALDAVRGADGDLARLVGRVAEPSGAVMAEEDRSKEPSLLSVVRCISSLLYHPDEPQLGLYGALGYDLMFQFEPIEPTLERNAEQRDVVLYVPDEILVVDRRENAAWRVNYDFSWTVAGASKILETKDLPRGGDAKPYGSGTPAQDRDVEPGGFAKLTERAKEEFKCGNLFEVVLSQKWAVESPAPPSSLFRSLRERNPSPYGFLMNLRGEDAGDAPAWLRGYAKGEYLVGASPEMFVRVERVDGRLRVETCPISGTIERGADALEDALQVRALLGSKKDESELTMCTDVDRNDKSRICEQGSVEVIGRRQIEMYSKLIHTVDHVEGYLREGFDALDAFLCHTWAVTVTGAPKAWAARFIENHERSARAWYGGAVGHVAFDGSLNTGLTLRTIHIADGVASVRAGATLLYDSDADAEEAETELKASAMINVLRDAGATGASGEAYKPPPAVAALGDGDAFDATTAGAGKRVLLVDHEDSFVHTLANYLRQTGADVQVSRFGAAALSAIDGTNWDLVVLSPGPGRPSDFDLSKTLDACAATATPVFGVCLGLQGIVEHFGGTLGTLPVPVHGKPAQVLSSGGRWKSFDGLPPQFDVARYHSLYADDVPPELRVTATTDQGDRIVVMAIEHADLPITAVQFHPESILTNPRHGLRMLANCLRHLAYDEGDAARAAAEEDVAMALD